MIYKMYLDWMCFKPLCIIHKIKGIYFLQLIYIMG